MTLQELRYVIALADHGHFGRAATACHVSQPTLSTQLKKLEDFLGVQLFERTNRALHITPVGQRVVDKARAIIAECDAIVSFTKSETAPLSGVLNLGVIPTLAPYILPWLVPALGERYPQLRLSVYEDLTAALISRLRRHHLDAALLALPVDDDALTEVALFEEPFWLLAPRDHPVGLNSQVTEQALGDLDLLLLTDGHCLRDQALAACGKAANGDARIADLRATSLETIRQMVTAGMGCTLMPALSLTDNDRRDLTVRPLQGNAGRRIGLVWRNAYPRPDDLRSLADVARSNLPAGVSAA